MDSVHMLCFGAHPDDVEIGMGGTIAKHVHNRKKVGIVDLTMAELSSNGTPERRHEEALQAASILGVHVRLNMQFADRGLSCQPEMIGPLVELIRKYKPDIVFAPDDQDRHPDHRTAAALIQEAVFNANIRKFQWGENKSEPHRVSQIYYYFINGWGQPDVVVDISKFASLKKQSLAAYASQFKLTEAAVKTRLNERYTETIQARDQFLGHAVQAEAAEGFKVKQPILLDQLIP